MTECDRYSELMSLKLDARLDGPNEQELREHVHGCKECAHLWAAMLEADEMLWNWMATPEPMPAHFHSKVMAALPSVTGAARPVAPAISNATRPLTGPVPGPLTAQLQDWQRRAGGYVRGLAITGLALASLTGVLLVLLTAGVLPSDGAAALLKTYFQAADTWLRSLFVGIGPAAYAGAGMVLVVLALVGWQVVTAYHRSAGDERLQTGYLEATTAA